ncbi:bifunctional glutamate N-acetyltransferase/amino-acid acetyltransferase ArgJ [Temperatibacter marinus]|uniref:Arginine biosynthesis bifunctional protein ArgJ n=1 Tax=Temperatibacter marinus TaxID=1456591 RepID=A0AA52EIA7_9PROT|nr:bifunctional glutamate N-acetyltransferase/amino-acid acetyltransferase ArgJ [Temperatibacter marinus]WND03310.1 bifunctional glutamate N-acetyltransferase/amino-acid acetyltransferase ArgJ [Temperatibacter marinus]
MSTDSQTASPISPLAPKEMPILHSVSGLKVGTTETGMKYKNRDDLLFVEFDEGTQVAGVFTQSKTPGAPVDWTINALKASKGQARALIVNAGNANAFTGKAGLQTTQDIATSLSRKINCSRTEILQASTGVIGEPLDPQPLVTGVEDLMAKEEQGFEAAAKAILTTDTFPKAASAHLSIHGCQTTITGIAKGSGMIAPDMATMLGFIFTDARIAPHVLHQLLQDYTDKSFNAITVDSDTSTSDMVLLFATGASADYPMIADCDDPALDEFKGGLQSIMIDLAHQIVRDGEGATKFVEIEVTGAEDNRAAKTLALAMANSPLVKTAIAGEDPNWGRLIMAAGKSGERVDRDKMKLWIGDQMVANEGARVAGYSEEQATTHMKGEVIRLKLDGGTTGTGTATVWTCDLTHGYITINADYRS